MLRKLLIGFGVFAVGTGAMAAGAGVWFVTGSMQEAESQQVGQVLPAQQYVEVPTLPIVIAEKADGRTRYLECKQTSCRVKSEPENVAASAVFSGTSWYFYAADGSFHKHEEGEDALLVAPSDVIAPREILSAPGGQKVAYWLDNIAEESEGLTELWAYSRQDNGTFVIGERLVAADIVTEPRWNGTATALWFLADSGAGKEEKLEFIVANASPPLLKARFANAVPSALQEAARQGLVDITPSGTMIAFASANEGNRHTLHVIRDGGATEIKQLPGNIAYLQWIGEGELLYAVQERDTVSFWRYADATHTPLTKQKGMLLSALVDDSSRYVGYIMNEGALQTNLRILDLASGLTRLQSALPSSKDLSIIYAGSMDEANEFQITTELTDGQLIAFIEDQAGRIVSENAKLVRAVVTDKPNTLFIDFRSAEDSLQRILVTVRDAVHPEWAILARYESVSGEWSKVRGGGVDPKALRLYEWEESAGQWILKQTLDK